MPEDKKEDELNEDDFKEYTKDELADQVKLYQHLLYQEKRSSIRSNEYYMLALHIGSLLMMWLAVLAGISFHWIAYIISGIHIAMAVMNIFGSYTITQRLNLSELRFIKMNHECCLLKYDTIVLYAILANIAGTFAMMKLDIMHGWTYCAILTINAIASLIAMSKLKSTSYEN